MRQGSTPNGKRGRIAIVAVLTAAIVVAPMTANAAQTAASKQDVRVTNTAAEPVPVAGTVGVNSLPAVQIDQAANGVRVTNGDDSPVPVRLKETRAPFQRHFIMSVRGGQRCDTAPISLVPDGTRVVITSMNVRMYPITGVGVRTFVQAHRSDGSFANLYVPLEKQAFHDDANDRDDYVGNVETTLVHENAYPFFVSICMSQPAPGDSNSSLGVFQGNVFGYTEPISG